MSDEPARLGELLRRLVEADVRFVLVGGFAVIAWGYLRTTRDIDIVPDPDRRNLDRLATLLEELDGRVLVAGEPLAKPAIRTFLRAGDKALVRTALGEVDVLQGIPQIPSFGELDRQARPATIDEITVRVCSLEHLLAMKRDADRAIDRADLEALEAAHEEGEGS